MLIEHTETAQQGAGGADAIMHHILAHKIITLPTVGGIDLSITNHILMMIITATLLIAAFVFAFRKKSLVPSGLANALEFLVDYIMKDAILANMGPAGKTFAPYLLTAFFFILVANLIGLVPFGATATGNMSVTSALALLTLFVGQFAGIKKFGLLGYFKHFIPPDLPLFIIPIMIPVEIVSLFAKHIALAIRLFANMIAGHITILAVLSLIYIFKNWFIVPLPLAMALFVALLEILISLIQAYVFTTLSAVFISMSISEEH